MSFLRKALQMCLDEEHADRVGLSVTTPEFSVGGLDFRKLTSATVTLKTSGCLEMFLRKLMATLTTVIFDTVQWNTSSPRRHG